jgi:hypothetical protein
LDGSPIHDGRFPEVKECKLNQQRDPGALFALRLAADLLTAMVVSGVLSKAAAGALVDDSLANLLETHPEHEEDFREIAGTLVTQVGLVSLDVERKLARDD